MRLTSSIGLALLLTLPALGTWVFGFPTPLFAAKSKSFSHVEKLELLGGSVAPQLFSPNSDGVLDEVQIVIDLAVRGTDGGSGKGKSALRIFGEIYVEGDGGSRTLWIDAPIPKTSRGNEFIEVQLTAIWDGFLDNGEIAPDGIYFIRGVFQKVQIPPSGKKIIKDEVHGDFGEVEVDATAPTISIFCPEDGSEVSAEVISLSGYVTDNGEIVSVSVNALEADVEGNSFWINELELSLGDNFLVGTATDQAGNVGSSEPILVIRTAGGATVIMTWVGNGTTTSFTGPQEIEDATLSSPRGLAIDESGALYIADTNHHQILKVDAAGMVMAVAGTGSPGFSGDGGAATQAMLRSPQGIAFSPDGLLYIVDAFNRRIRKVDSNGIITTVAGTGGFGFSGDGGPAASATFRIPQSIDFDSSGNFYIADAISERVRKVDPNGIITRVAGGGSSKAEGIPATEARLPGPVSVTVTPNDELLISDRRDHCIRKVSTGGILTIVAGAGRAGFSGDGGDARQARLNQPNHARMDEEGAIWIVDTRNHRIRRVDPSGMIETVAGTGGSGFGGDGGPPLDALLYEPERILLTESGSYFFADTDNHRVRKVLSGESTPPIQCTP